MVSTTPYQGNDYNSANTFRPMQLPINDIFKAISAQNKYWDDGAALVKSKYEDALGMDLTSDANKEFRDNYLKEAEKQLTKLSTKNLADRSVQREGLNLFKPLLQDKALKIDSAITTKLKDIYSTAESYKGQKLTKDGRLGEGYNDLNLGYALKGFEKLNSNTPRDEKYFEQLYKELGNKAYTPFVDVSQEYLKLKDKCKSSSNSVGGINSGYIITNTTESLEANTLTACIKGGLSDASWNQLKITGTMKLQGDPATIAQMYKPTLVSESKGYAKQIIDAQNERDGFKKTGKLTPELEKAYENYITERNDSITKNNERVKSFDAGDYSYISNDIEGTAQRVWADYDINSFSQPNAWSNTTSDVKADPKAISDQRSADAQLNRDNELIKIALTSGKTFGSAVLKDLLEKRGIKLDDSNEILPQGMTTPTEIQELGNVLQSYSDAVEAGAVTLNNDIQGVYNEITSAITDPITKKAFDAISIKSDGTYDFDAMSDFANKNGILKDDATLIALRDKVFVSQLNQLKHISDKKTIDDELSKSPEAQLLLQGKEVAVAAFMTQMPDDQVVTYANISTKLIGGKEGEEVRFTKQELNSILSGKNSDYKFEAGTNYSDYVLSAINPSFKFLGGDGAGATSIGRIVRRDGKVFSPLQYLPLEKVNVAYKRIKEELPKYITNSIKNVIQYQSWNVNTPEILAEMKQIAGGVVPLLLNDDKQYQVRSLATKKGPNNETLAKVQILKYDEKDKNYKVVENEDIFTEEALSNSTVNDFLGKLTIEGKDVWITTSANKYYPKSPIYNGLLYQVESHENVPLKNRQQLDLPGRPLPGGKSMGVTMIGTGNKTRTYRIYVKDAEGNRTFSELIGETADLNDIANKLEEGFKNWNKTK